MMVIQKQPKQGLYIGIMLLVVLVGVMGILAVGSKKVTDSLAREVIRFHVVANSDTTEDQLLKQQVRDEIIEYMRPFIQECESIDETREVIAKSLPEIQMVAERTVWSYGKDYAVYVVLDRANFPTKAYGDVVLPAGEYEACRVVIGEGKGENWWCVMYPPLCYVDAASGVVPLEGKEQLKEELNEEQYKLVVCHEREKYQVRFKIIDKINSIFCRDNYKSKR